MTFTAKTEALKQCHTRGILTVRNGDNTMQTQLNERVIQQAGNRLRRKTFTLIITRKRKADFGLLRILLMNL